MKVTDGGGAPPAERAATAPRKRFADVLRTTERAPAADGLRTTERAPAPGRGPKPLVAAASLPGSSSSTAGRAAVLARGAGARRTAAERQDEALRSRRETFREEARLAPPPPDPLPAPDAVTVPELRALVRTLPLAIQTFGIREGAPLALSFGRSLDVELRAAPRGVEVVLRPEPRLARACDAELRDVVAALAAKGIQVSRAEVRVRAATGPGERTPCVDVPAGVR